MTIKLLSKPAKMLIILAILMSAGFLAAQSWNAYTNTNHVTDVVVTPEKIYSATWGGVVEYYRTPPHPDYGVAGYNRTITSVDGLSSNDVRTLAFVQSTGDLWAGTYNDGITIIRQSGLQVLDATSGLPSNKIRRITSSQNHIYVATDQGISQFYYLPGVYFPLLLHQYNVVSTQGGLISNDVNDLIITSNNYLYCATSEGVSFVHTDSLDIDTAWHSWIPNNSPLPFSPILSISANDNYVAMNSMTSIHRHSNNPYANDWNTWTRNSGGLQDSVFTVRMSATSDNILFTYGYWNEDFMTLTRVTESPFSAIGTDNVVINYGEGESEVNIFFDFPEECIYRIFDDAEGSLYFTTWGQGIYVNDFNDEYTYIEFNNCIGFQTISEIVTDRNNKMWFGSGWLGGTMTKRGTRGVSAWSGGNWSNYNFKNSPLPVDNIRNVAVDANNNKWFGSWDAGLYGWHPGAICYNDSLNDWKWYTSAGIRQWDEAAGWSEAISGTPRLLNNTIAEIATDKDGNILISSSGAGTVVLDDEYNYLGSFQMPASYGNYQSVSFIYDSGSRFFFGLNVDNKLVIWNNHNVPLNTTGSWELPDPTELTDNAVYGVVTIYNIFGEEENWIATSQGLFMWDGTNWYRYDTDIKRRRYNGVDWVNDTLYYVDEERLFGSVREARPTAIFLDPFNRIWVGSLENGITMYDPETERFTNYYQDNSPLLSNYITCFGYDPIGGNLLIGTPEGLNTLKIGILIKTETKLRNIKAFPNPFFPDEDNEVMIVNMPSVSMPIGDNICRIYDSTGQLVIELEENIFARFDWNGLNKSNKKCSSGIYFYVVTDSQGVSGKGKLALIRGSRTN
jgi:hypothetical protein